MADLHTIQFTITHSLGFSVFASRILVTELKHFASSDSGMDRYVIKLLMHGIPEISLKTQKTVLP
jgi:hypothetical protein